MSENLYAILHEHFPRDRSRTLLETDSGEKYTYEHFAEWTARYAAWLRSLGVAPGDRVLVQADKSAHVLFLCFACIRAGFAFLPLDPSMRRGELRPILEDADPKVTICGPPLRSDYESLRAELGARFRVFTLDEQGRGEAFQGAAATSPQDAVEACAGSDLAALMYTSGTTGQPKGAMITHRNLSSNGAALRQFWKWRSSEVLLHTLPFHHLHGLFVATLPTLLSGARIILQPRFLAASAAEALPRATVFMGVPTYYSRLLELPELTAKACNGVRLFISGSAPLGDQTIREFERRTGHSILNRYGMTEAGGIACSLPEGPRAAESIVWPLPGMELLIADEAGQEVPRGEVGEVLIRGESVSPGYWRKPEETAAVFTPEGFLRSGDLGRRLENGAYAITGRAKDLVITGGLNVNPKEVEAAIDACEGIAESAVIGVPHPDFGEAVVAIVVLTETARQQGREGIIPLALLNHLKQQIAGYKVPKRIFIAEELPRNSMGKVLKNLLRAEPRYARTFESEQAPGGPAE